MDNLNNKKPLLDSRTKLIVLAMAVVILGLIIILVLPKKNVVAPVNNEPGNTAVTENQGTVENKGTSTVVKDKYREEVPANIVVPDTNTKLTEEEKKVIAIPTVVTPAAPGVESQFRSFDIKGDGGVFVPNRIIARVGDTVHVNFTAVDKDYDIIFPSYNMKQTAKKGQTRILEFQAVSEGSFLYYCQSCGGETGPTKGNIIVAK